MQTTIFLKTYNYTGELKFPLPTQVNYRPYVIHT